jgi:hypothetical protein
VLHIPTITYLKVEVPSEHFVPHPYSFTVVEVMDVTQHPLAKNVVKASFSFDQLVEEIIREKSITIKYNDETDPKSKDWTRILNVIFKFSEAEKYDLKNIITDGDIFRIDKTITGVMSCKCANPGCSILVSCIKSVKPFPVKITYRMHSHRTYIERIDIVDIDINPPATTTTTDPDEDELHPPRRDVAGYVVDTLVSVYQFLMSFIVGVSPPTTHSK